MNPTKISFLIFKLAVTSVLLWYVFTKVDLAPLLTRFESLQLGWSAAVLAILLGQLLLTGVRWHIVSDVVGAGISYRLALQLMLMGHFFNQVLPSTVGGDGVRAWLLSREGIPIGLALVSVVCDRITAVVMLTVIVVITLPIVLLMGVTTIPKAWPLAVSIGALTIGGLFLLYCWGNTIADRMLVQPMMRPVSIIVRGLRAVLFSQKNSLRIVLLSVLVQALIVLSLYLLALSLQIQIGMIHLLMFPLIILVSTIPLSFAGWGLRESAMVVGLGFVGITASDALVLSVTFGLGMLCISLLGLAILVLSYPWQNRNLPKIQKL